MKLRHEVEELRWLPDEGKWRVRVQDLATGARFEDKADFVAYATGLLSKPVWPKIPGRESYKGILHHSAGWDAGAEEAAGMDWSGKRVGVIGVGSSAIQIVPEMQKRAREVVNFGRSKTWLSGVFSPDILAQLGANTKEGMNRAFSRG
jgi:cation diffusion facilitator CzcD-associated flavoprotein CzcO